MDRLETKTYAHLRTRMMTPLAAGWRVVSKAKAELGDIVFDEYPCAAIAEVDVWRCKKYECRDPDSCEYGPHVIGTELRPVWAAGYDYVGDELRVDSDDPVVAILGPGEPFNPSVYAEREGGKHGA